MPRGIALREAGTSSTDDRHPDRRVFEHGGREHRPTLLDRQVRQFRHLRWRTGEVQPDPPFQRISNRLALVACQPKIRFTLRRGGRRLGEPTTSDGVHVREMFIKESRQQRARMVGLIRDPHSRSSVHTQAADWLGGPRAARGLQCANLRKRATASASAGPTGGPDRNLHTNCGEEMGREPTETHSMWEQLRARNCGTSGCPATCGFDGARPACPVKGCA
jgi:hypothetical protein